MENNNLNTPDEKDKKETRTRPLSYYDNYLNNSELSKLTENGRCKEFGTNSPSQAHCLMTTVPQNIAAQCIGGKHTPTRNSLRHSRMIVLNRSGRVPTEYLPAIIKYHTLAKLIVILLMILGSVLCLLSFCLLVWSPNLRKRDNPFWGAIPVLASGIIGSVLLCCCPKEYPGRKLGCYFYSIKYISITTSAAAIVVVITMCFFATVHLIMLATATCLPPTVLNNSCECKINATTESYFIRSYHYEDLNCTNVQGVLKALIIFSCVTNGVVFILELLYLYLYWSSRYKYTYFKVPLNEIVNKSGTER